MKNLFLRQFPFLILLNLCFFTPLQVRGVIEEEKGRDESKSKEIKKLRDQGLTEELIREREKGNPALSAVGKEIESEEVSSSTQQVIRELDKNEVITKEILLDPLFLDQKIEEAKQTRNSLNWLTEEELFEEYRRWNSKNSNYVEIFSKVIRYVQDNEIPQKLGELVEESHQTLLEIQKSLESFSQEETRPLSFDKKEELLPPESSFFWSPYQEALSSSLNIAKVIANLKKEIVSAKEQLRNAKELLEDAKLFLLTHDCQNAGASIQTAEKLLDLFKGKMIEELQKRERVLESTFQEIAMKRQKRKDREEKALKTIELQKLQQAKAPSPKKIAPQVKKEEEWETVKKKGFSYKKDQNNLPTYSTLEKEVEKTPPLESSRSQAASIEKAIDEATATLQQQEAFLKKVEEEELGKKIEGKRSKSKKNKKASSKKEGQKWTEFNPPITPSLVTAEEKSRIKQEVTEQLQQANHLLQDDDPKEYEKKAVEIGRWIINDPNYKEYSSMLSQEFRDLINSPEGETFDYKILPNDPEKVKGFKTAINMWLNDSYREELFNKEFLERVLQREKQLKEELEAQSKKAEEKAMALIKEEEANKEKAKTRKNKPSTAPNIKEITSLGGLTEQKKQAMEQEVRVAYTPQDLMSISPEEYQQRALKYAQSQPLGKQLIPKGSKFDFLIKEGDSESLLKYKQHVQEVVNNSYNQEQLEFLIKKKLADYNAEELLKEESEYASLKKGDTFSAKESKKKSSVRKKTEGAF